MTIEEWRESATLAMNLGPDSDEGVQLASALIRDFDWDMSYGGPLARLDSDGFILEDEEVNEVCRMFGYAEMAGE